jgi:DNA-directed RNA polymerase subunit RPC12/RpoP
MPVLPCFLCGRELDQRTDKNRKSYFVCDGCGMQIFVRRAQGMENLDRLVRELKKRELPFREHAHTLFEIRAILQELDGIEREKEKIDSSIGIFSSPSKEKQRAKELLKKRSQTLLDQLERIAG